MPKIPSYGGTLIIEIVDSSRSREFPHKLSHSPPARVLSNLQVKSKLGNRTPSDHVEEMLFRVVWMPERDAFGVSASPEDLTNPPGLSIVSPHAPLFRVANHLQRSDCLDFEKLLSLILLKHSRAVLKSFQLSLYRGRSSVFSAPGTVVFIDNGTHNIAGTHKSGLIAFVELPSLKVSLCADAVVYMSIDQRTGRLSLRDNGNLAATSGGSKFSILSKGLNDNPPLLFDLLITLRMTVSYILFIDR
jgi:mediator of RNA polymerase II transcription subunit 14